MDYKKVLRLHFVNHLSSREIAESCGDCGKISVNEFLKRFRESQEPSYPLPPDVTNEYIENLLYKKPGVSAEQLLYRVYCKIELPKVANGNWRMLHLQIGESCKAFARSAQERCSA